MRTDADLIRERDRLREALDGPITMTAERMSVWAQSGLPANPPRVKEWAKDLFAALARSTATERKGGMAPHDTPEEC